ncbi:MAG TPA: bifunctional adenosylcobinamide kinase/adenosylcobinamide-phosphate guanylyltransferase, partial [Rhizobacter sp.]|nr:bifunctional adenosylcobinamide kinase/adenosylcobinamide-phosphate guanylyltransferase [Rhizobacter sp.]
MTTGGELILGGQRSGKSRCAEQRAAAWLAQPGHSAVLLATALAHDDEMRERIARHRADRARRVPALQAEEVPLALAEALRAWSTPQRLVVVDCLTLWVTNLLMPMESARLDAAAW